MKGTKLSRLLSATIAYSFS